jgi:hypothetical protein
MNLKVHVRMHLVAIAIYSRKNKYAIWQQFVVRRSNRGKMDTELQRQISRDRSRRTGQNSKV